MANSMGRTILEVYAYAPDIFFAKPHVRNVDKDFDKMHDIKRKAYLNNAEEFLNSL